MNLPTAAQANLAGSLEVAGITFQPGTHVSIFALPPGAVVQSPPGGGPAVVPPGAVLGITSAPELGRVVTQTPIFVDVLGVGAVRAPAPQSLPQAGVGPASEAYPQALPQTGGIAGAAGPAGSGLTAPLIAGLAAVLGLAGGLVRRRQRR